MHIVSENNKTEKLLLKAELLCDQRLITLFDIQKNQGFGEIFVLACLFTVAKKQRGIPISE